MLNLVPARKLGMTSIFDGAGTTMPATIVEPYDLYVLRKKTVVRDGYNALVLAYEETREKHVRKPKKGELDKAGINVSLKRSFEIKMSEEELTGFEVGQVVTPDKYLTYWGEANVTARSKGRGFAGVMKRHNFKGVKATHGHTIHRKPASGGATDPARQFKGSRRPGHMGNESVTIKNLSVFEYSRLHNIIVLQGNVPGPKGGLVWVSMAKELDKKFVEQQEKDYLEAKALEDARAVEETEEAVDEASVEAPPDEPEAASQDGEPVAVEGEADVEPSDEESGETGDPSVGENE